MEPTGLEGFLQLFKIDPASLLYAPPVIISLIAFIKQEFGLTGKPILLAGAIISLLFSAMINQPDVVKIISGMVAYFLLSVGPWAGLKQLAHKIGVPKT